MFLLLSCTICLKWLFSPQLQHVRFGLFGKFPRLFDLIDFVWALWFTSPLVNIESIIDESPISCLLILSLRTTSRISSNFSFSDPWLLLIATTTISQGSDRDDIETNALISFLKLICTKISSLYNRIGFIYMIFNRSTSDICRLNNLYIKYTLFIVDIHTYLTVPSTDLILSSPWWRWTPRFWTASTESILLSVDP